MNSYLAAIKKYADFSGRARRKEFWLFTLMNIGILFGIVFAEYFASRSDLGMDLGDGLLSGVYLVSRSFPSLAVQVRRLHDTDHSVRWFLIPLVPFVGWVVLFILLLSRGTPGPNRFGPDPKSAKASRPAFDPDFA